MPWFFWLIFDIFTLDAMYDIYLLCRDARRGTVTDWTVIRCAISTCIALGMLLAADGSW
jgi:hypothetical protein